MNSLKFLILFILIIPINSFAAFYEVSFDFGYDSQKYGVNRQNTVTSRNYSYGLSVYLFDLTAIDFNASNTQDTTTQNDRYTVATSLDIVSQQNRVKTDVYGVGIKQMLAGRGSRIIPSLSIGYAKQSVTSSGDVTVENTITSARTVFNLTPTSQKYNSVSGTFALQLKLTDRFSLKGSVRTLFPAFEFSKAKDNLKYLVGFSWIF